MKKWAKRVGVVLLVTAATFVLSSIISCCALTVHFDHLYPHNEENGLIAIYFAFIISAILSAVVFITLLLTYGLKAIRNAYHN